MSYSLFDLSGLGNFGTKKEQNIGSYAPATNVHQPYETYSPTSSRQESYNISPQYTYAVQISSPDAVISTKKEDTLRSALETKQEPRVSVPQTTSTSSSTDISPTTLVIGAAAVLIAAMVLK